MAKEPVKPKQPEQPDSPVNPEPKTPRNSSSTYTIILDRGLVDAGQPKVTINRAGQLEVTIGPLTGKGHATETRETEPAESPNPRKTRLTLSLKVGP
jgi:hypothetical protein